MDTDYEALTQAVRRGNTKLIAEILAAHPQLDQMESPLKVSFFMMALYSGQRTSAEVFLNYGHILTFHEAAAWGDVEKLAALVARHPDQVNSFSIDGFQPLGLACFFGHESAVQLLLNANAAVNDPSQNFQQVTPLHSAAASNNTTICQMLLERGAQVNVRQQGAFTPLHAAAQNGNPEMTRLFLHYGAEVNARTSQGITPLSMAKESRNEETFQLLKAAGGVE